MTIQHEDDGKKGAFYHSNDNERLAQMTYVWTGAKSIIIDHTDVSELLKGQGAGKNLFMALVAWAEKEQVHIIPLCPFAKSLFEKMPQYNHLIQSNG